MRQFFRGEAIFSDVTLYALTFLVGLAASICAGLSHAGLGEISGDASRIASSATVSEALTPLRGGMAHYRQGLMDGNYVPAARALARAAEQADPTATLAFAYLLGAGKGIEIDTARARQLLLQMPVQLKPRAAYIRGLIALDQPSAENANRDAEAWWQCAAEMGDALAMHRLASVRERQRHPQEAGKLYQQAQVQGVLMGGENAARVQRVTDDTMTATKLGFTRRDAYAGKRDAMFALGRAYHRGESVPVSIADALNWYARAGRRGHAQAQQMSELMLISRQHNGRLDYGWITALAYGEPSMDRSNRQTIRQERDPLWQLESLMQRASPTVICDATTHPTEKSTLRSND
jgi:TPR repeat protein